MAGPPGAEPTQAHGAPTPEARGAPTLEASGHRPARSLATAYLVWFLVGILGGHRFYLGDVRGGRRFLIALVVGVAVPVAGLAFGLLLSSVESVTIGLVAWLAGLVILFGLLATTLLDAFRLPAMTRRANGEPDRPPASSASVEAPTGDLSEPR